MLIIKAAKRVEKGKLIEFRVQGERRIAVVDRPEGKKDWMVIDIEGQCHKIRPQRVEYEINGGSYTIGDIPQFLQEVEPYLDPSSLEVAWELLVENGQSVTPSEMAQLLFSEVSPAHCYAAHSVLCDDKIYFKKKGDSYEPRTSGQVEEIKHQLEVERQRQREKEVFFTNIKKALAGQTINWTESDRNRLELLERLVLQPEQTHRNAQETLDEIGRLSTPEAAFELLVELGWWSRNENLFLRRSSYPIQFSRKVLDVVQFYLETPPLIETVIVLT